MGAAELLRRHHRHLLRVRLLQPYVSSSSPPLSPIRNPSNSFSPSNNIDTFQFGRCFRRPLNPNLHPLSRNFAYRSFSWTPWTVDTPTNGGGGDSDESTGAESEIGLMDGAATGSELSNLECDGLGTVEEAVGESVWYLLPLSPVISLLDGFHDLTGLPWWIIIVTSTVALRAALLPVLILQLKKLGEIAVLFPKLPPPFPPPLSGKSFKEQFMLFQKKRSELGCPSFLWNLAYFTIQFPCFLLWMSSIRKMCLDHHPGFDIGGTMWFQNLTALPHGVLGPVFPILIAGLHYVNVQIPFRTLKFEKLQGTLGLLAKYYKLYLEVLAIPFLLIGFIIPQGSHIYWFTSSLLTLVQQLSLKNPYVREKLGLPKDKVLMETTEKSINENYSSSEHMIPAETLSSDKLLDVGLEYLAAGHADEALALLRLAIKKDPELMRALIGIGQILCSKKLFAEAAEYFERAISKIPEEELGFLVLAYYGAGVSHISQGKKPEGIEYLKRIAELNEPEDPMNKACYYSGLVMLGSTLFNDGEKIEAAKYLRRAATYDPAFNAYVKQCEDG